VNSYRLSFKPTDKERREHIERLQGIASQLANKVADSEPLEEWERGFISMALLEWGQNYSPTRMVGQSAKFSHVDASIHYALLREDRLPHAKAISQLLEHLDENNNESYPVSAVALWNAIRPNYLDTCAHLALKPQPIPK
jgi:hypothetical protein